MVMMPFASKTPSPVARTSNRFHLSIERSETCILLLKYIKIDLLMKMSAVTTSLTQFSYFLVFFIFELLFNGSFKFTLDQVIVSIHGTASNRKIYLDFSSIHSPLREISHRLISNSHLLQWTFVLIHEKLWKRSHVKSWVNRRINYYL